MKKLLLFSLLLVSAVSSSLQVKGQPDRWQQRIKYQINVNMDVNSNRFSGTEKIDYWNNSPDTLNRIFFTSIGTRFNPIAVWTYAAVNWVKLY